MSSQTSPSIDNIIGVSLGQAVLELKIGKPNNVMVGNHLTVTTVLLGAS